jgi:endonuclease/exonuclease/phosphatase family metal-dependent hydrolase
MRRLNPLSLMLLALVAGCAERSPTDSGAGQADAEPFGTMAEQRLGPPGTASVLTRNLYLGGDIGPLLGAPDPLAAAAAIWEEIQHTDYPARAAQLAREIAELQPDLVGLQEAVRFTIGPFPATEFPTIEIVDFLSVLDDHLVSLGESYSLVAYQPNTAVALPLMMGESVVTIGYQDAVAILVRDGVETENAQGHRFAASPPIEFTAGIPFLRGWTQVDARVGGGWVRFVNTHLEIQSFAPFQTAQTAELLASLEDSPHPVILVGDFNSAANPSAPEDRKTPTYGMILEAGFDDLWTRTNPADSGLTCCHAPDLSNPTADFDQRLDIVFARNRPGRFGGFAGSAWLQVVGADDDDRFTTPTGTELWPSDHAGVHATLHLPRGLSSTR